jgi:glycosyltransferase involved in cell wall biosynthesis
MNGTLCGPHSAERLRHRRKAVIGHPRLGFGGSESNVMWLIEALKEDYEVTVVTTGGWDLAALNSYYGTQVGENEVNVRIVPVPFLVRSQSAAALRGACYQRFVRQIAGEYDVRVSAYNPTDWGLPAIHFIADFSWHRELRERLHRPLASIIYRDSIIRRAYLGIAAAYGSPSGRDVLRDDPLIANSLWTANLLKQSFGVDCVAIVYPSVWTEFPDIPWEQKENAFVMIGRIAPEKQLELAIAILEALRHRGHAIRLRLCGQIGTDLYGRRIAHLCEEHADWIVQEGHVSGKRKAQILANCRYGIQTCAAESFGISVAEMVKAGAIVFASSDGGQTEILRHSGLLFSSADDAVETIQAVLENSSLQSARRAHLAAQAQRFSSTTFMREARACIEDKLTVDHTIGYNVTDQIS